MEKQEKLEKEKPQYVYDFCWLEKEDRMFIVSGENVVCCRCGYKMKRKPNAVIVPELDLTESPYLKKLKGDKI